MFYIYICIYRAYLCVVKLTDNILYRDSLFDEFGSFSDRNKIIGRLWRLDFDALAFTATGKNVNSYRAIIATINQKLTRYLN